MKEFTLWFMGIKVWQRIALSVFAVLMLSFVWSFLTRPEPVVPPKSKAEKLKDGRTMASVISKGYALQHLKYPEEADFAFLPEYEHNDSNVYRIQRYVTAKNAFGVKSKLLYDCRLRYDGDIDSASQWPNPGYWHLLSFDMAE